MPMHGGLPVIGVSVLVYGVVGALVIGRDALNRCFRGQGRRRRGGGRGVTPCAAASQ